MNWARNLAYSAQRLHHPRSLDELCALVAAARRSATGRGLKAVGSRHSFSTIADTPGDLIALQDMPRRFELDEQRRSVTIDAGTRFSELSPALQAEGWALKNMASLPHITVVGSVITGTHGSGTGNPPLSSAVSAVEMVLADGSMRTFTRGEPDFDGVVVSLGALGIVTAVTLDIIPSFRVRQDVYPGLSWEFVLANVGSLHQAAYSVSLFTTWGSEEFGQAWLKSVGDPPEQLGGVSALRRDLALAEGSADATTAQSGVYGSWDTRLPHFKAEFTPSNGQELQSEYLVPLEHAAEALQRVRSMGDLLRPHLLVSEIRTIAADRQWMSPACGRDSVGLHFTWRQHPAAVSGLMPLIEQQLLPLGARPHWGKLFATTGVGTRYPGFPQFRDLAEKLDPTGAFSNDFLTRYLGLTPRSP